MKPRKLYCEFCQIPDAELTCEECGDVICFECFITIDGRHLCPDCAEDEEEDIFNLDNYSEERDRESRFDKE